MTKNERINRIVAAVQKNFKTFGGTKGSAGSNNPLDYALAKGEAVFALGVEVDRVVEFVLARAKGDVKG